MTRRAGDVLAVAGLLVLAGLVAWGGELSGYAWANHDAANALYVGKRILEGDRLYVDWHYFVMPPVVFLSAAAYALSRALALAPTTALHLLVVLVSALGLAVLRRNATRTSGAALISTAAYLALAAHAGLVPSDFAQREHFFALLFVPYLFWRLAGTPSTPTALVLTVALGFIAMVKPHFLIAVAAVEVFRLRERPFDVWGALLLGGLLPFVLLALHSIESFEALFTRVVPYQLASDPGTAAPPLGRFLLSGHNALLTGLGALLVSCVAAARRQGAISTRFAVTLVPIAALLYVSTLLQRGLFPYHYIPFVGVTAVATAVLAERIASRVTRPSLRRAVSALLVGICVAVFARGVDSLGERFAAGPTAHGRSVLPLFEGQRLILLMSTSVEGDVFRYALEHDLELMRPWTSNYTVFMLLANPDESERERSVREYFAPLARRIEEETPGLVVFSPFKQWTRGATMHDVFVKQYGLFPTDDYRLWRRRRGWIVYRRVGAPAPE